MNDFRHSVRRIAIIQAILFVIILSFAMNSTKAQEEDNNHGLEMFRYYDGTPKQYSLEEFYINSNNPETNVYPAKVAVNPFKKGPVFVVLEIGHKVAAALSGYKDFQFFNPQQSKYLRLYIYGTSPSHESEEALPLPLLFSENANLYLKTYNESLFLEFSGNNAKTLFNRGQRLNGILLEQTIAFKDFDVIRELYIAIETPNTPIICYERILNQKTQNYTCMLKI